LRMHQAPVTRAIFRAASPPLTRIRGIARMSNTHAKSGAPGRRPELPALDLLRGFEAAARHLSFTHAAAELFRTQSAISRQIQALEAQLGVPLFERRHRALALTEGGQLLLTTASQVLRVCAPALLKDRARPLRGPADLRRHVLLHDDPGAYPALPYLEWSVWLEAMGCAGLEPAGALHFSHYDQMIQAALGGEGVAL